MAQQSLKLLKRPDWYTVKLPINNNNDTSGSSDYSNYKSILDSSSSSSSSSLLHCSEDDLNKDHANHNNEYTIPILKQPSYKINMSGLVSMSYFVIILVVTFVYPLFVVL